MKQHWTQRLALAYYRTKIKTIERLSPRKAADVAFDLFCTPRPGKESVPQPPIFEKGKAHRLKVGKGYIRGFHWSADRPKPKTVLIAHGFSSQSYKFDSYVRRLLAAGFDVVAFDAPAHGLSDGKRVNALEYRNAVLAVMDHFGPLHAIVCHSFGGLVSALALEERLPMAKTKLVLIAPAIETKAAMKQFFSVIPASAAVQAAFAQKIKDLTGKDPAHFSLLRVLRQHPIPTLWIHDRQDQICLLADAMPLLANPPQWVETFITEGLGHNRIYRDQVTKERILAYLERD